MPVSNPIFLPPCKGYAAVFNNDIRTTTPSFHIDVALNDKRPGDAFFHCFQSSLLSQNIDSLPASIPVKVVGNEKRGCCLTLKRDIFLGRESRHDKRVCLYAQVDRRISMRTEMLRQAIRLPLRLAEERQRGRRKDVLGPYITVTINRTSRNVIRVRWSQLPKALLHKTSSCRASSSRSSASVALASTMPAYSEALRRVW